MNARSTVIVVALCILAMQAAAIDASNRYRSPRSPERSVRRSTELIVLHTTEAPARSSLNKVSERGECHFCVTEEGSVYRIVDRDKEAFHAGRSMWNGKEDVDKFSIGIECVGYHDKPMSTVQLNAIAKLVKELQSMYRLPDHCVVAHSHVAYGAPNKWQKKRHRGRKRCGMLFATATVRRILGLKAKPGSDADVKAKRLVVADAYLNSVLYGGVDIMAKHYPKATPPAGAPAVRSAPPRTASGSARSADNRTVGGSARSADNRTASAPSGGVSSPPKTVADLKSGGYKLRGKIEGGQTALKLVGAKWNASDTYYVIRGKLSPGNSIDPAHIEKGTEVWRK